MTTMIDKKRPKLFWMQTHSGKQFHPFDPKPDEICVADIAHALAMCCRFNGHVKRFYSVAEHCVRVSKMVPREDALWGLLHDAAEAYISDIPKPFKDGVAEHIDPHEEKILEVIANKYNLEMPYPDTVKHADWEICVAERFGVMWHQEHVWDGVTAYEEAYGKEALIELSKTRFMCWDPKTAKRMFLERFTELV